MNREKVIVENGGMTLWDRFQLDRYSYREWIKYSLLNEVHDKEHKKYPHERHGIEHKTYPPPSRLRQSVIDELVERFSFKRGFLLTLHFPSYLNHGHTTKKGSMVVKDSETYFEQISYVTKKFRRRLERKVYKVPHSKKGKNTKHKLGMVSVIEGVHSGYGKKNHLHMVVETPQHLSMEQFELFIRQSHGGTIVNDKITKCIKKKNFNEGMSKNLSMRKDFKLGKIHFRELDNKCRRRLYTYLTKEVKEGRYTVDWKNSYHKYEWSKSLTIKKEKNKRRT